MMTLISSALCDSSKTIAENIANKNELSTLLSIVTSEEFISVSQALSQDGSFTLFAPSNEAFAAANLDTSQTDLVLNTLLYHALPNKVLSDAISPERLFADTLLTNPTFVQLPGGKGQVIGTFKDEQGNVKIIDGTPVTQSDEGITVQRPQVIEADIEASNGVIHVIDKVLAIPQDIATVLQNNQLTTLLDLVVRQGLADQLTSAEGLTVFAPTNDAFSVVPPNLSNQQITRILSYHVVPNNVIYSSNIQNSVRVPTSLENKELIAKASTSGVQINRSNVVLADILLKNGVAHVIDQILDPKDAPTKKQDSKKGNKLIQLLKKLLKKSKGDDWLNDWFKLLKSILRYVRNQ